MQTRFFSMALASLLIAAPAQAIVNIEAVRTAKLEAGLGGEVGFALNMIDSSTDELRLDIDSRLDWVGGGHHDFAVADGVVSEVEGVQRRRLLLHLRHVQALDDSFGDSPYGARYNWELFAQAARDDYALLRERSLAGTGIRWNRPFAQGQDHALGIGVMSERRQSETDAGREDAYAWRANLYLALHADWGQGVTLGSTTYYQPRLDESDDFGGVEELSLDARISDKLSLRFLAAVVHDSRPPPGVPTTRQEYGLRIVYRFSNGK